MIFEKHLKNEKLFSSLSIVIVIKLCSVTSEACRSLVSITCGWSVASLLLNSGYLHKYIADNTMKKLNWRTLAAHSIELDTMPPRAMTSQSDICQRQCLLNHNKPGYMSPIVLSVFFRWFSDFRLLHLWYNKGKSQIRSKIRHFNIRFRQYADLMNMHVHVQPASTCTSSGSH